MGTSSSIACCTERDGRNACDLNSSIFGEDAYYRDADRDSFHDCSEGNVSHDDLFRNAREQVALKVQKGSFFANYASYLIQRQSSRATSSLSGDFSAFANPRRELGECSSSQDPPLPMRCNSSAGLGGWQGKTMTEWTETSSLPATGEGPYWQKGDGQNLKVRSGPNYKKNGHKIDSDSCMYQAVSCDAIKGDEKIQNIIGRLIKELPPQPESFGESSLGAGDGVRWSKSCPLPRVICLNGMLPYESGLIPFKHDPGASFVACFHIKPETVKAVMHGDTADMPAAVRQFLQFVQGPAGEPGGAANDPDRSLYQRVDRSKKMDLQSGLLKVSAQALNLEEVSLPDMCHKYNGKPCLITKSGYIIKDPHGEWMEIGVDIRGFNILCRKMLCSFGNLFPKLKVHFGLSVQGFEDEELPEGLVCDLYVYGLNIVDDPFYLTES